jgi:hypothetical protein
LASRQPVKLLSVQRTAALLVLALFALSLSACASASDHVAASAPYRVEHVRQVFAAHRLRFSVPRNFAVGYACTRLTGLRALLDGGSRWHGELYKDERSATKQDRCLAADGVSRTYLHLRRRNLVIVARTSLRRRIRAALAGL